MKFSNYLLFTCVKPRTGLQKVNRLFGTAPLQVLLSGGAVPPGTAAGELAPRLHQGSHQAVPDRNQFCDLPAVLCCFGSISPSGLMADRSANNSTNMQHFLSRFVKPKAPTSAKQTKRKRNHRSAVKSFAAERRT